MAPSPPLLDVVNLCRQYDSAEGVAPLRVLDGISLKVERGETVAICGPSGSGKSTLLHIAGTLDRPSSGKVLLNGLDLSALNDLQLADIRSSQIGFVFQAHYLLPQCTVLENVLVPTLAKARKGCAVSNSPAERAGRLLTRVGLSQRLDHRPGQLSGGERQRVAVVRALINCPALLLADEPTGALDHNTARDLAQLLVELNKEEGTALILATHSLEVAGMMQRVLNLRDGKLVSTPVENQKPT